MVTDLLIFSRALHLGSGLMLVTVVAFRWLILLPALGQVSREEWMLFHPLFSQLSRMFVWAGIILVLSGLTLFWAVASEMSGMPLQDSFNMETMGTVAVQTQFGHVSLGRLAVAAQLSVVTWRLMNTEWQARRQRSPLEILATVAAVALLISFGWMGHAAASSGSKFFWNITADSIHLLAASIWPAGLLPFALFLAHAQSLQGAAPLQLVSKAVRCFSLTSLITVIALTATGFVNGYCLVGSINALLNTSYGQVLCCKLILVFIVLCLASWNRYRILPQLFSHSSPSQDIKYRSSLTKLRIFVLIEFSLAVAIILTVSVLGTMPPAR